MPVSESALRGRLQRKGYALAKSRARNEDDPTFGCYHVADAYTNTVVYGAGSYGYELDLEDAAAFEKVLERNWRM